MFSSGGMEGFGHNGQGTQEGVEGFDERVQGLPDMIRGVDDGMQGMHIDEGMQGVGRGVEDTENNSRGIQAKVEGTKESKRRKDRRHTVQGADNNVDLVHWLLSPNVMTRFQNLHKPAASARLPCHISPSRRPNVPGVHGGHRTPAVVWDIRVRDIQVKDIQVRDTRVRDIRVRVRDIQVKVRDIQVRVRDIRVGGKILNHTPSKQAAMSSFAYEARDILASH
jgi:hypothetical protein